MDKKSEKGFITKNGYMITSNGLFSNESGHPVPNNFIDISAPELGIGIQLMMSSGVAIITSSNVENHRMFSSYWDEHDFNDVLDTVGERDGGVGVFIESCTFLKEFIENSFEMCA